MAKKFSINVVAEAAKRQVVVSGYITDENNSASQLMRTISEELKYGLPVEVVFMNCYGGNVYEGIPVYNFMKKNKVNTVAEGLIASMATVMYCGGKERMMSRMSRAMIHAPSTVAIGNANSLRTEADHLDQLAEDFANVYAEVTGMDAKTVQKKWLDGNDHYLSASECLACGFATKLTDDSNITAAAPDDVLLRSRMEAIAGFYERQIENNLNTIQTMSKLPLIAAALTLATDANEQQVLDAINALNKKVGDQAKELEAVKAELEKNKAASEKAFEAQCDALVDGAEKAKKIAAGDKARYKALAKLDFDNTKAIIESLPSVQAHVPLSTVINGPSAAPGVPKHFTMSYQEASMSNDKYVTQLQKSDPETFKKWKAAWDAPLAQ